MILSFRNLNPYVLTLASTLAACGGDDGDDEGDSNTPPATHAQVLAVIGKGTSCAVSSCHGSATAETGLALDSVTDLTTVLNGKPSCEAPAFKLVEPGDPDKSWLYIKLSAAIKNDNSGDLVSEASWGTAGKCSDQPAGGFGKRMPRVGSYEKMSEANLAIVRGWILAGAPGPTP